jgi:catechol 2,3-dioxygenase-like lactoylglutathione lyase family enzyme
MLKDCRCAAMIPASDFDRAKTWYEKLGFEPVADRTDEYGAEYECADGTRFAVYPSQFAGTGQQTVMGWEVPDIEVEKKELENLGVTFEEYDLPGLKTENGIAGLGDWKGAWFKDSEGNILAISQRA